MSYVNLKRVLESDREETEESKKNKGENIHLNNLGPTPKFIFSARGVTTELHIRVAERNPEAVLNIIQENGKSINFRDETGRTPLHVALSVGDASIISILLSHGSDPGITDSNLRNSLIVEIILEHFDDINSKDKDGKTVLHILALKNDLEVTKKLLAEDKLKEHSNSVNITNNVGQASLHIAAYLGNAEFIKLLILFKCDLDIQDNEGLTSLHNTILASAPGNYECFKILISYGSSLTVCDKRGLTPLHLAVITSRQTMIDYLLTHLADLTLQDANGMTALHHACKLGNIEAATALLNKTVHIDIQDNYGWTVLHYAIVACNESLASMVLDHQPDLLLLDFNKISYIEHELYNFKSQIFLKLMRNVARRYRREEKRETWLHFCAAKGYIDPSEILLKEGFDIDQPDAMSQTPLHYAIRSSEVVKECKSKFNSKRWSNSFALCSKMGQ